MSESKSEYQIQNEIRVDSIASVSEEMRALLTKVSPQLDNTVKESTLIMLSNSETMNKSNIDKLNLLSTTVVAKVYPKLIAHNFCGISEMVAPIQPIFALITNNDKGSQTTKDDWEVTEETSCFDIKKTLVAAEQYILKTYSLSNIESLFIGDKLCIESKQFNEMCDDFQNMYDEIIINFIKNHALKSNEKCVTKWSFSETDEKESHDSRLATLYPTILLKMMNIALSTRQGSANRAIVSPNVVSFFKQFKDLTNFVEKENDQNSSKITVREVGKLDTCDIVVYCDYSAKSDFVLLGHKNAFAPSAGIIFTPYNLMNFVKSEESDEVSVVSRHNIVNVNGSGDFYQYIEVDDLTPLLR